MNLKRLTSYAVIIFLVFSVTGLILFSSLLLYGPRYIEKNLIPEITRNAGLNIISVKVRNIGVKGAELSDIRIGKDQKEDLIIDSIRIDYSLPEILNRIIDRVTISGLNLTFEYRDGGLSISGLDDLIDKSEIDGSEDKTSFKPIVVKNFEITNSKTRFIYNDKSINIPFGFTSASFSQFNIPKELNLILFPEEHEIIIDGKAVNDNKVILSLVSDSLPLDLLEEFLTDYFPLGIKGETDLKISFELSPATFALSDISASLIFDSLEINYSGVALKNPEKNTPIELFIKSEDALKWQYQCSPVLTTCSSQSLESDFEGSADLSGDTVGARIMVKTAFADNAEMPAILWDVYAFQEEENPLNIKVKGVPERAGTSETFQIEAYGSILRGESPEIEIDAEYDGTVLISSYGFALKNIKSNSNKMSFSVPLVSVKGKAEYDLEKGGQANSSFSIESSSIMFNGYDLTAEIPGPLIKGSIEYDDVSGINAVARLFFSNGAISGSVKPLKVAGLSGSIPFIWPFSKKEEKGKLSIETLSYEDYSAGPLNAEYTQSLNNIFINGKFLLPLLPDMNIHLSAEISLDPAFGKGMLNVQVPSYHPADDIDLKKFIPELEGTYLNGEFKLHSDISYSFPGLKTEAILEVKDGRVSNPEKDIFLEKISLSLKITDLFSGMSAPGQKLKINKITYGDIIANNFNMDFRIDPVLSLFVEQGDFKWADGKININSFKIIPGKDEYDITLFCDRLNLAQVLSQFGVAKAAGEGTVNGKIPLRFIDGRLIFEDGFLYSTPGSGGKILLTDTSILTASLTPGTTEYTQVDIAREALKDFDYSWVRLMLNSEEEDLLMRLQFDGKPAKPLPFAFDRSTGSFLRIEGEGEGSNFQGLRLDVNFRLPLEQVLKYKDVFDMFR